METVDNSNCDTTEDDSSVSFQNHTHVSPNSQSESDVVKSSSDAVSRGLSSTLATVIRDFDSRAEDALRSQDQLSSALHRLTRGLICTWITLAFYLFIFCFIFCVRKCTCRRELQYDMNKRHQNPSTSTTSLTHHYWISNL